MQPCFFSSRCYHNHIRANLCARMKLCKNCSTAYTVKKQEHDESYCKTCITNMPTRHECYMPIKKVKKDTKNGKLFIFYGFECYQDKYLLQDSNKFEHEVMLCVAHRACNNCTSNDDIEKSCDKCGKRE